MRYRALSATDDYQFGRSGIFLTDSPEAVGQAVLTRLRLWTDEWFLDSSEGTPFDPLVLGYGTQATRDIALKARIVDTPGVLEIVNYYSTVNAQRQFTVTATINTIYGQVTVTTGVL